jgi:hypothetical protein
VYSIVGLLILTVVDDHFAGREVLVGIAYWKLEKAASDQG